LEEGGSDGTDRHTSFFYNSSDERNEELVYMGELQNPLYDHPWAIPETIHTYLIFKHNYLTPSPTHQHGYEKAK
jgi:hypothetical protein